jgi:esterase/lipase
MEEAPLRLTCDCFCRPIFVRSPQTALTCLELTTQIQQSFRDVTVPFLCMIADEDVVVDNAMANELMRKSPSKDKTLKSYAALHGLLCEPAPLLGIIEDDFVQWLLERCPR